MPRDVNTVRPNADVPDESSGQTPEPGSVHVLTGRGTTRVVLSGEVDADLGPALLEAAADAAEAGTDLEVDVQHVTFMDSTGVAFLARLAKGSPTPVLLLHPTPEVRYLLDITGVSRLLTLPVPAAGAAGGDGGSAA